ncbi:FIST signal transduction protein [Pseudooceanicola sp. 200-1SW]|uniref:FIST signal transduction protein n=1 Tax=Pseudooceanicola sp. 200-1SW TaxID=3425949 RepID=UPI003D7F892B
MFTSSPAGLARLHARGSAFRDSRVISCIGAGEIGPGGYAEGGVMGLGLPRSHFRARTLAFTETEAQATATLVRRILAARSALQREVPGWTEDFALLLIDAQRLPDEAVAARIASALGPIPMIGATLGATDGPGDSAADPAAPRLFCGTGGPGCAALLLMVRGRCPVRPFRSDHFIPAARRMVVTGADPAFRLVRGINGAPAAHEYARLAGLDPAHMGLEDFIAHPALVRVGQEHFMRTIRRATPHGGLEFHSAVGEGMVLTLARAEDMAQSLDRDLTRLARQGPDGAAPLAILAFDSHLRRIEAAQRGALPQLSQILAQHRVFGLSSRAENLGGRHLNHSLTGLALYPPIHGAAP